MTSNLSLGLELDDSTEVIQLGRPLDVRGIKEEGDIIYPKFLGLYTEAGYLPRTFNTTAQGLPLRPLTNAYVSDEITVVPFGGGAISQFGLQLPYPAVCRIQVSIAYRYLTTGAKSFGVTFPTSANGVSKFYTRFKSTTDAEGVFRVTIVAQCDVIGPIQIRVLNINQEMEVLRNRSEDPSQVAQSFYQLELLGRL